MVNFGLGTDANAQGDYDGDGITDWAKVRNVGGTKYWYLLQSTAGFAVRLFGAATDILVPADYDNDGRIDEAVFRPSTGQWWVRQSGNSSLFVTGFGTSTDVAAISTYIT